MEKWKAGLLKLSRETLMAWFDNRPPEFEIQPEWLRKAATFVTITKHRDLRGCIGSTEAFEELYKNVMRNTINAAFHDPRFPPLQKRELKDIKIEISILSAPKAIEFSSDDELFRKILNKGVILEHGGRSALFLPQVWEQIPEPHEFLRSLCWKAGLEQNCWRQARFRVFEVDSFGE